VSDDGEAPAGSAGIGPGVVAAVLGVFVVGAAYSGAGFLNGDAAAYASQAWQGDLGQRWVHLGYLVVARGLSFTGEGLPVALDLVSAAAAAAAVAAVARGARWPTMAAGLTSGCVLPWAPFAEVDLVWIAALLAAASARREGAATAWVAAAVAVSPTALLAVPWVGVRRGRWTVLVGAVGSVALLTLVSQGQWWWGERGVSQATLLPGRTLQAWLAAGTWLLALLSRDGRLLALLPLLLAPPDVPAWVLLGAAAAEGMSRPSWWRGLVGVVVIQGLWGLHGRWARVAHEAQVLASVQVPEGAVLEAPWSWGARWSVLTTGSVYGGPWVAVPRPVRDQQRCPATAVGRLPPGDEPTTGVVRVDEAGVAWGPGC